MMSSGIHKTHPTEGPKHVITRTSATQYLVLNSKNRNQSSVSGSVITQPWNDFRLQRPQNLMESFARRLVVSEVRFPWWIPNITSLNNSIWILTEKGTTGTDATYKVSVAPGFYTPAQLVSALNIAITTAVVGGVTMGFPPVVSYSGGQYKWTPSTQPFKLYWFDPGLFTSAPPESVFISQPSLSFTMGMNFNQVNGSGASGSGVRPIIGNITETLYTQFIDIVSSKFNLYTTNYDGSSDGTTSKQLICRLYLADEISNFGNEAEIYQPTLIHRQFKNAKAVMWNPEAVVDWFDIQVLDQFGQLIPLPVVQNGDGSSVATQSGSYPDFQITLLATES